MKEGSTGFLPQLNSLSSITNKNAFKSPPELPLSCWPRTATDPRDTLQNAPPCTPSQTINNASDLRLIFLEGKKLREQALTQLSFCSLLLRLCLKLAKVAVSHLRHHALSFSQFFGGISQGQVVTFFICTSYLFQEHWKKVLSKSKRGCA